MCWLTVPFSAGHHRIHRLYGCILCRIELYCSGITPYDARNMRSLSDKNYFTGNAETYVNVHNQEITKEVQLRAAAEAESIVYLSIMIQ